MRSKAARERGGTLITALALVAVSTLTLAGVGTFVTSHVRKQVRDADYTMALQLAEAAVNYELRYIGMNMTSTSHKAHHTSDRYIGSIPGISGTFEAYVAPTDGSTTWSPPNPMFITGIGRVNGVTRMIRVQGVRQSIFNSFSVFAINQVAFSGSDSSVIGSLATNGTMNSSSVGSSAVTGTVLLAGPTASGPTGPNVYREPDRIDWPPIDTVVQSTFPGGWSYLTSNSPVNRANGRMRMYSSASPALTPTGTVQATLSGSGSDVLSLTNSSFNSLTVGLDGVSTLILPPGDYYFTGIQLSGTRRIIIDNGGLTTGTPGQVRIWMNGTSGQDTINIDVTYTSTDKKLFRLYYNKPSELSIAGSSTYYGGFYAVRPDGAATITVTGSSYINGTVVADLVKIAGGSVVDFPLDGDMDHPTDYSLWYGTNATWRELAIISGGTVFPDGTNN
jgi:hypothetical protein